VKDFVGWVGGGGKRATENLWPGGRSKEERNFKAIASDKQKGPREKSDERAEIEALNASPKRREEKKMQPGMGPRIRETSHRWVNGDEEKLGFQNKCF